MAAEAPGAWKRALLGVHALAAVLPILCMATILVRAAGVGFAADRALYSRGINEELTFAEQILAVWNTRMNPQGARGRIVVMCGMGEVAPTAESQAVRLVHKLSEAGVRLRVVSEHEGLAALLPAQTELIEDLPTAATGAHALAIVGDPKGRYLEPDYEALAPLMAGVLVFDITSRGDGTAADRAGLQFLNYGAPLGPPWLDPELRLYAEHLIEAVPAKDGILLVPSMRPSTVSGRARWFLHLNNLVFPRRLYLQDSFSASGTSVQFRQWVMDLRQTFPARSTRNWEPQPRDYSAVTGVGPARTLTAEEQAAIEANDIQWVCFFSMNPDFRLQDWELMTAERALAGQ